MEISEHYDEIARCNRCGFCQAACPVFRSTGHEAGVARGRIALLRAMIEGRLEWDRQLEEPLFACLICGACTANCFPAVDTANLILDARSEYLDRLGGGKLRKLLLERLLPYPGRLRLAARAAALGKRSGLSKVAGAVGLLRVLGRDLSRAEQIVSRFPKRAFREKVAPGVVRAGTSRRIGYFVGCGMDIICPQAAEATLDVLKRIGGTICVLDNCCCGLPAVTYGDRAAAQRLAEKNLAILAEGRFDLVVTDCSSCAAFLKKYPTLFAEDDPRHQAAVASAARVRDILEILPPSTSPSSPAQAEKLIVTYHDPCHASRGQGLVEEPRAALRSIAALEYRELPEADWCCGGAGSYAVSHYDLSWKVLERKMDNLEQTGAKLLVTSCPACIVHLAYGVRKRGLRVHVCHISELISQPDKLPTFS